MVTIHWSIKLSLVEFMLWSFRKAVNQIIPLFGRYLVLDLNCDDLINTAWHSGSQYWDYHPSALSSSQVSATHLVIRHPQIFITGARSSDLVHRLYYYQASNISCTNPKTSIFLVSSYTCLCPIHWSQVLSWERRRSWSSADRRCSNYIWVINNFIVY